MILIYIISFQRLLSITNDSSNKVIVPTQEAVYSRPFITQISSLSASLGGYCEGNSNYLTTDGVTEGLSFELRRFNIFIYSSPARGIKFLSELEFEHGTEEIRLETAQIDFEFAKELVLRGGIVLIPIGSFNLNHDSPKWDIIDRPLVSTKIIPSTFSEIAFGILGHIFLSRSFSLNYSAYISNGLGDGVILNSEGRTLMQSGKSVEIFTEDNNGSPALSGRTSILMNFGEIGISFYRCIYNSFKKEELQISEPLNLSIVALDFTFDIQNFKIKGEAAYNNVEVPKNLEEIYGKNQAGSFIDFTYPFFNGGIGFFSNSEFDAVVRLEAIDYNIGKFKSLGTNIYDEVYGITAGISIKPAVNTVLKLNYLYRWEVDLLGNPTIHTAGMQLGLATYF